MCKKHQKKRLVLCKSLTGKLLQFSTTITCPRKRTLLKGYSPSLLSDTIWKAVFLVYRPIFNALRSPDIATKKDPRTIQTAVF